jgi:hypothetical protein
VQVRFSNYRSGTHSNSAWYRGPNEGCANIGGLRRILSGHFDATTFRSQSFLAEADAWLDLAEGLRVDASGDRKKAHSAYFAFQALPLEKRLLDGFRPSPVIESFVAWRAQSP